MSDNFNLSQFSYLAKKLLDKLDNGDEFLLGDVHRQVRAAYERFPEDTVIRQMSFVVEKMAEKNSPATIVSQKQLSTIYNDLVRLSGDTKFRNVLGHLILNAPEQRKVATELRNDSEKAIDVKDLIDPAARNVLEATFDADLAAKAINKELAEKGVDYVKAELKSLGAAAIVKVAGGDAKRLFYSASFDAPRGVVSVYVPVNVTGDKFVLPTTFIDDAGEKQLTKANLSASIARRGGDVNGIVGSFKQAELGLPELKLGKVAMPTELAHLTSDFEDAVLETTSSFGREAVGMGRKLVANELRMAGFKNAQVRFGSDSNDSIVYVASINTPNGKAEIEVPVELKATMDDKYVPLIPTVFAYNETLMDFNAANLQKFALSAVSEAVTPSGMYSFMVLPELKEELVKAASNSEFGICEEILGHIGATFGSEVHKNAIADYQYVLSVKSKVAAQQAQNVEIAKQAGTMIPAGKGSMYARLANGSSTKDLVLDTDGQYKRASEIVKEKLNPGDEGGACIQTSTILFS
jgi:hypothetical protein